MFRREPSKMLEQIKLKNKKAKKNKEANIKQKKADTVIFVLEIIDIKIKKINIKKDTHNSFFLKAQFTRKT